MGLGNREQGSGFRVQGAGSKMPKDKIQMTNECQMDENRGGVKSLILTKISKQLEMKEAGFRE